MLNKEFLRSYYLKLVHDQQQGWFAACCRAVLRLFSWIYTAVVIAIRWAYRHDVLKSYDLGRPVISVGNITWGGVGKTPLVEWIAQMLWDAGNKPVVLMRGYMPGLKTIQCTGRLSDEAQLLNQGFEGRIPVIVNKDRVQGALTVPVNYCHDTFILDDGFQHWRVKRDLNIVAIDALNPFGNQAVLPRGILREPLSVLKEADLIVIMKADLGADQLPGIKRVLKRYCPAAGVVEATHQAEYFYDLRDKKQYGLNDFVDAKVLLISAIGSPDAFERTAKGAGLNVQDHLVFPDHHLFNAADAQRILEKVRTHQLSTVVMTAKDAVKFDSLLEFFPSEIRLMALTIRVRIIEGERVLRDAVSSIISH